MILKSLLVVACIAIYVRAQQPCLHAPQNPHSFAASPLSCAHYTICMGGNTIIGPDQQCQPGFYFDPPTQTCVRETSCMECSPFGIQNLPYPDDCSQYIECILGNRRIVECPSGLKFDRSVGQCNKAEDAYCPGQPTDPPTWPTDPPTEWPTDPPTEWPTNPPTEWPTNPPTEWPTNPPGGEEPVCRGQVFHAHPSDCELFFICIDSIIWIHQCPSDLHWNQLISACDLPAHARCLSAGGGGTTTTGPPLWPPPPEETTPEPPLYPPPEDAWTTPKLLPPK